MTREQYNVEDIIEEQLNGLSLYEQKNLLEGIVRFADNLLDNVKEEIEKEEL